MYSLTIKIPLYKVTIHVKIAPNIRKVINNFCKKKKWKDIELKEGEDVYGYAISSTTAEGNYYIFYEEKYCTPNYLTHEVSHVVDYILSEKDIETTGEARAYLTGHLSEKIFDFVLKKGLLISKYLPKQEPKPINVEKDEKPGELLQEVHSNP